MRIPSILTIDDEPENLQLISRMLEQSFPEISIYSASSGRAGIKLAQKYKPDTIILDIMMPDMDGYTVCEILKGDEQTRDIPIIVITGMQAQMKTKIRVLELGADAFLTKPLRKAELIAQIKAMLRIKFAEDRIKDEKRKLENLVEKRTEKLMEELKERRMIESKLKATQKALHSHAAHTLSIQEDERMRISRELHDELGQMLIGLQMGHTAMLDCMQGDIQSEEIQTKLIGKISELSEMTDYLFDSVKKIIYDLRPPVLDHLGLMAAIEWLTQDFEKKTDISISVSNELKKKPSLADREKTAIFRIMQEALNNIIKHADASAVRIHLGTDPEQQVQITINDNGKGFQQADTEKKSCFGLMGMKERANQFNWSLDIDGSSSQGTTISLRTDKSLT